LTDGKKTALSLLISVLAFCAFVVVSFTGLFNLIEIKFYQPRVINRIENNIEGIEQIHTEYTNSLIERFSSYAAESDIKSFLQKESSAKVQKSRINLTGSLINETTGLLGIRIIDSTGRHIHYSTFTKAGQDLKTQSSNQTSYLDYAKIETQPYSAVAFNQLKPEGSSEYKITYYVNTNASGKKTESCIIYAIPFYNESGIEQGTVLFYTDDSGFNRYLLSKNHISFSGNGAVFATKDGSAGGIVFGLTDISLVNTSVLEEKILELWQTENPLNIKDINIEELAETETKTLHLFTKKAQDGTYISFVYDDASLVMSDEAKFLLLAVIFVTLFLFVFLILNLKHDDMTVIRDRIKRFQLAFITEYLDKKDSGEISGLPEGLSERRLELSQEIKKSLGKRGKKHSDEVEKLLDSSWNEILTALGAKPQGNLLSNKASIDSQELRRILEEILGSGKLKITASQISSPAPAAAAVEKTSPVPVSASEPEEIDELDEIEEAEDLDSLEEVESLDEVEEADSAEELDALEEVESLDEVEEAESADELDALEEVESLDEVEEAESADELDALEEVESLDEVEEAEAADELDALEEAESLDEVDEVAEAEESESLDEVEEIADAEDIESLDEVEEVAEAEEAESLDEVEEVAETEEAESLDEVEEVAEAEEAESLDEVEDVAEAEEPESLDEVEDVAEAEEAESLDEVEDVAEADETEDDELSEVPSFDGAEEFEVDKTEFIDEPEETVAEDKELDDFMIEEMIFSSPALHKKPEEENKIVNEFDITSMDFSSLDEEDTYEDIDENAYDEDLINSGEARSIDDESDSFKAFSFNEALEAAEGETLAEIEQQEAEQEDFAEEPELEIEDIPEDEEIKSEEDYVDEVQQLESPEESNPFLFTTFAANNDNITDLQSELKDAIVEKDDGTYSLEFDEESSDSIEIDDDFKKLVDSVLK